jgi:hypothetical protein
MVGPPSGNCILLPDTTMQTQDQKYDSSSGCLIHLFWLIVGNVALLIVAGQILFHTGGRFSVFDAIYWLFVVLILAARYADIRFFKGTTVDGKPSTLKDLRAMRSSSLFLPGLYG